MKKTKNLLSVLFQIGSNEFIEPSFAFDKILEAMQVLRLLFSKEAQRIYHADYRPTRLYEDFVPGSSLFCRVLRMLRITCLILPDV